MTTQTIVLKFGGSVLRDESDLAKAVHEIYRHWRQGKQVLAVVSAFNGRTDELLERSRYFGSEPNPSAVASLLATGEAISAALLALALDRAGLPAKVLSPEQAKIKTIGHTLDAEPVSADTERIGRELAKAIVIVSGFVGVNDHGDLALLGRGGTDFTALFLAHELGAECRLIKDVDGLYDRDPAITTDARRFARANFQTALQLGGKLVQPKAVRYAERKQLQFELTSFGSHTCTSVGNFTDEFVADHNETRPLRVALLGCGTVGGGVYERLLALPDLFEVVGVANLCPERALAAGIDRRLVTQDPIALIERECDVVIELIGGVEPANTLIRHALKLGRHVVTANKALLAQHQHSLQSLAALHNVSLRYSASVGGVLPALEAVAQIASIDRPLSVSGIINGTCNFICDRLAEGASYETALDLAREAGLTEADPTLDLDGTDAAQKLILLARAAFGVNLPFESIHRTGIDQLEIPAIENARKNGRSVKLVAECIRTVDGYDATVRPVELSPSHPFADARGADNCLLIETESGSKRLVRGRGAGRFPTTESVLSDLFDLRGEIEILKTQPESEALCLEVCA
jgi:homoserine dehydrogenase